jgi:hypothetical protein
MKLLGRMPIQALRQDRSITSRVPKATPKGIWSALDNFSFPDACPKAIFRPARPNRVSGASPSLIHRGRFGCARHNEKRGEETQGPCVSGKYKFNLTAA